MNLCCVSIRTAIQAALLASVGFGSIAIAAPGDTTRVSVSSGGLQGDKVSHFPSISADGRFVAFIPGTFLFMTARQASRPG